MQQENNSPSSSNNMSLFQKKVWTATAIVAFVICVLLILKITFGVFLLVLAGSLIAIFFRGLSSFIERKTNWKEGVCVAISIISTLAILAGLFLLIGAKVQAQIAELMETLPQTIDNAKAYLNNSVIGSKVMDKISSTQAMSQAQGVAGQFFSSTFGIFGDLYVILFIGIFLTIAPNKYINGVVQLVPQKGQKKAREVSAKLGEQLRKWLKGKLFSMFVVFVLTAIGLAIIGMPMWLVLALLAGLISFVPNFGPLIALIPAVLIALMQSPTMAALVVGLYVLIQFIESNFITTFVQQKLIDMPPALLITAQLIMGALTGGWGLVLATPLMVIVMVLVQQLYLKDSEGNDAEQAAVADS